MSIVSVRGAPPTVHGVMRSALLAVAFLSCASTAAPAQSFFEQLFGFGQSKPAYPPLAQSRPGQPAIAAPTSARAASEDESTARRERQQRARDRDRETEDAGGAYQTMCVRTCDGYYWPVRYPVARRDFKRDAAQCEATCGADTKLYYRPGPGIDAEEMKDMDGRSYGASETAFAYRRGLINGCACRPMPWTDGERARHEAYALIETEKAIRIAQAEADKATALAAAAGAKNAPENDEPSLAMANAGEGETPASPGPAEAAAIAEARLAGGESAASQASRSPARSKSRRIDTAQDSPAKRQKAAPRVPVKLASSQAMPTTAPFFVGGPGKFTYPGDAPRR
jgi:Protein of unknown function (DUF2865)